MTVQNIKMKHKMIEEEAGYWLALLDKENLIDLENIDIEFLGKRNEDFSQWVTSSDAHRVAFLQLLYVWKHEAIENTFETKIVKIKSKRSIFWGIAATILFVTLPSINYFKQVNDSIYETAIGSRQTVSLSDGSKIELNSKSKLTATISDDERIVTISEGEAFFDIAHKDGLPFRVLVGQQLITVLGTKFSVQKRDGGVKVVVREGKVQVDSLKETHSSEVAILTAGSIAIADAERISVTQNAPEVVEKQLSWRDGLITFDGSTLAEAATEFNRYNQIKIKFDKEISNLKISGQFESKNYDAFLRLISDGYGLKISYSNDNDAILVSG